MNGLTKIYSLLLLSIFITGCSQSPEEIKEDLNKNYIAQAKLYFENKIAQGNKTEPVKITSFTDLSIDTIVVISSREREYEKMMPFVDEVKAQYELAQKFLDIDKIAPGTSPITEHEIDKATKMKDSADRWMQRADKLSDSDTIGYKVQFRFNLEMSDGKKMKDRGVSLYFDPEHDLHGDWNK